MKRILTVVSAAAASVLLSALVIFGEQSCPVSSGQFEKLVQSNVKNQCLIVARNCIDEFSTVQQRIDELRVEIAKGSTVYTADELRAFQEQLGWIEKESGNQII